MNIRDFILSYSGVQVVWKDPWVNENETPPNFYCSSQKSEITGNKNFVLNTRKKAESFGSCELVKILDRMLASKQVYILFLLFAL